MKTLMMTGAAAATLGAFAATDAHAADLYTPPPAYNPPEPVWSWTGPYAGLHVGTVDGDVDGDIFFGKDQSQSHDFDPNGIMGGVQAGYNVQFDSIVLGLEGDVSFGDVDDVIYPFSDERWEAEIDWMATIRARLGYAWDRTLFYASGGVAFTDLKITADIDGGELNESQRESMLGWTVGGGVEHAVSDSISLRAEYLYADFGKETFSYDFDGEGSDLDADLTTHTFRVGVNWLF